MLFPNHSNCIMVYMLFAGICKRLDVLDCIEYRGHSLFSLLFLSSKTPFNDPNKSYSMFYNRFIILYNKNREFFLLIILIDIRAH